MATKKTEKLELRPEVETFAQLMERELRKNDHKGGWQDDTAPELVVRLIDEVNELVSSFKAIGRGPTKRFNEDWIRSTT